MRFGIATVGLLAAVTVGCGHAAEQPSAAETTQRIAGGTLDLEHLAVFQAFTRWEGGYGACTATLIAPNVLLTARHCVAEGESSNVRCGVSFFGDTVKGSSVVATNAAVPAEESNYYRGLDIRVPAESNSMCGYDVALIILSLPVLASVATPAVPRIDRPVEVGEPYVAVGYGVNDEGEPNPGRMTLGDLGVRCASGCERAFGVTSTEFLGDTGICSGDSGGPALDAAGKVIGVASRGSDPCQTPIYGQVSSWRDLIIATVLEAAAGAGYQPPFWAFSGSSDLPEHLLEAGELCADTSECNPGHACYFDADPATARCVQVCANSAQCGQRQECRPGFDVQGGGLCFDLPKAALPPDGEGGEGGELPPGQGADDSCSLGARPRGSSPFSLATLAFLLVLGLLRKRNLAFG
jgi:hypothetical protein